MAQSLGVTAAKLGHAALRKLGATGFWGAFFHFNGRRRKRDFWRSGALFGLLEGKREGRAFNSLTRKSLFLNSWWTSKHETMFSFQEGRTNNKAKLTNYENNEIISPFGSSTWTRLTSFILDLAAKQTHTHHVPARLKVLRCYFSGKVPLIKLEILWMCKYTRLTRSSVGFHTLLKQRCDVQLENRTELL